MNAFLNFPAELLFEICENPDMRTRSHLKLTSSYLAHIIRYIEAREHRDWVRYIGYLPEGWCDHDLSADIIAVNLRLLFNELLSLKLNHDVSTEVQAISRCHYTCIVSKATSLREIRDGKHSINL